MTDHDTSTWWQERAADLDELKCLVLAGEVVADHRVRDAVRRVK